MADSPAVRAVRLTTSDLNSDSWRALLYNHRSIIIRSIPPVADGYEVRYSGPEILVNVADGRYFTVRDQERDISGLMTGLTVDDTISDGQRTANFAYQTSGASPGTSDASPRSPRTPVDITSGLSDWLLDYIVRSCQLMGITWEQFKQFMADAHGRRNLREIARSYTPEEPGRMQQLLQGIVTHYAWSIGQEIEARRPDRKLAGRIAEYVMKF